jgi:hypothetical protein
MQLRLRLVARRSASDRKEPIMYKLTAIGALVVALAASTGSAAKGIRTHHARASLNCAQTVVIPPGRGYGYCGGRLWFRDPQTGGLTTGPAFWRHERLDRPDDHP